MFIGRILNYLIFSHELFDLVAIRMLTMEQEHQRSLEQHDQDLRSLQRKTESNIDFLKQEHNMAQTKVYLILVSLWGHYPLWMLNLHPHILWNLTLFRRRRKEQLQTLVLRKLVFAFLYNLEVNILSCPVLQQ